MAFYQKASKGRSPGPCSYTKQDMKHVGWCMKNGIKIAVQPRATEWEIEITINKSVNVDPKSYSGIEALKQMYKYYKYYYDKNNI